MKSKERGSHAGLSSFIRKGRKRPGSRKVGKRQNISRSRTSKKQASNVSVDCKLSVLNENQEQRAITKTLPTISSLDVGGSLSPRKVAAHFFACSEYPFESSSLNTSGITSAVRVTLGVVTDVTHETQEAPFADEVEAARARWSAVGPVGRFPGTIWVLKGALLRIA